MHTCALCFRNEKKKRQQGKKKKAIQVGEVSSLLQTTNKLPSPFSLMNDESFHWHWLYQRTSLKGSSLRVSQSFPFSVAGDTSANWASSLSVPEQLRRACEAADSTGCWLSRATVWTPPLQKRAKSCEHQRHWRWRPFTLIPRVAHSHTDSLKENVSWIHKLIGSTTNPSSAWLLIQLLCSKNMKWAGQETGMQPWRTTHSGIYTSKGENLINLVISFYMNFVRVWVQLVFRWMQIYLIIFKNKALALLRGSEA